MRKAILIALVLSSGVVGLNYWARDEYRRSLAEAQSFRTGYELWRANRKQASDRCPLHPASAVMRGDDERLHEIRAGETLGEAMARRESWTLEQEQRVREYVEATRSSMLTIHVGQMEHGYQLAQQDSEGEGNCYNDGLDPDKVPPEGKVACACHKVTGCDPNKGETHECKRHCRRDKCDCCAI